ncbi:hypothetical protein C1H46_032893 [Malus baccata]|uniref:sucrose synthase n=1 Tax=Malus baccata TaxID=106549 RepID=A0A540L503_MALBA|nr:hypothetical protein C1H46_032893 [Malus baccata]
MSGGSSSATLDIEKMDLRLPPLPPPRRPSHRQEAIILAPFVALALHPRPGVWEYVRVNMYELGVDHLSVVEYIRFKEEHIDRE